MNSVFGVSFPFQAVISGIMEGWKRCSSASGVLGVVQR